MTEQTTAVSIDPQQFREVLGHYPTGVALITGIADDGEPIGMIVGSFTSVSLDPPLVAFLPTKTSSTFQRLRTATGFTVNVFAHDQEELCRRFARPGADKFEGVPWSPSTNGAPVLDGVVASIDCGFHSLVDGGDHLIVLGEVKELRVNRPVAPLLFFQGGYGAFTPRSFMVRSEVELASSVTLAQGARADMEALAEEIDAEVTAFARIGNEVAPVATAASDSKHSTVVLGAPFPLMLPLGELFVAWQSQAEIDAWIGRAFGAEPDSIELFKRRLEVARGRGWSMSMRGEYRDSTLASALREYASPATTPAAQRRITAMIMEAVEHYRIVDLVEGELYDLETLVAPVYGADGTVQLVLRLSQLPQGATAAQIHAWAKCLQKAAENATAKISHLPTHE